MSEYIKKSVAICRVECCISNDYSRRGTADYNVGVGMAVDALKDLECEDVRENVRGEWRNVRMKHLISGETRNCRVCSVCDAGWFRYDLENTENYIPNFCPNCGADMRGLTNDE